MNKTLSSNKYEELKSICYNLILLLHANGGSALSSYEFKRFVCGECGMSTDLFEEIMGDILS